MSYISYLLYPDSEFKVVKTKVQELQRRYEELINRHQNNTFRLLDRLTYSCEETFLLCWIGRQHVNCCRDLYTTRLYINENKCFSNQGPTIYAPSAEKTFGLKTVMIDTAGERLLDWNISGSSAYFAYGWSITIIASYFEISSENLRSIPAESLHILR